MNAHSTNTANAEIMEQIRQVSSDRRKCDRIQSVLSGIILVDDQFAFQCVINEVSKGGMRLTLEKKDRLPSNFTVKTPTIIDGLNVELAWQKGRTAGVKFESFTE